ncbi:MAG: bacillithiol biosynthesis protein BshC [Candidatus Hodarchaeales archaeon]|jgi:hypothetical protein
MIKNIKPGIDLIKVNNVTKRNLIDLYEEAFYSNNSRNPLIHDFWNELPRKISDISIHFDKMKLEKPEYDETTFLTLKKIIKSTLNHFGVRSRPVNDLLSTWTPSHGTIEIGHQPLYLGGSSFLFGKVSFALTLFNYLQTSNCQVVPIFFLGDHDQVQNELTITRFPQVQSSRGLELKSEYPPEYTQTSMANLPKPSEDLLLEHLEKIRGNFRELFRYAKIKGYFRPLLEERLENALDMFYEAYLQSENSFSDFIARFWAQFFIIKNKSPVFLLQASDIELRKLMLPYFEELLQDSLRIQLIQSLNEYHNKIEKAGFIPRIPLREKDYVPFFLDCPNCKTRSRSRLSTDGSTISGNCMNCKDSVEISYNSKAPDLSDYAEFLSPRVDSRSIIINKLLRTFIRVTGGGETGYYAQLIPFIRLHNSPPLILKAPRIYYNSPWAEKTASIINFDKICTLHTSETFKRMTVVSKAKDFETMQSSIKETKEAIQSILVQLETAESTYQNQLTKGKSKQLSRKLELCQMYLSQTFGKYETGKKIQEVSWNWLDLGVLTGLKDVVGFYSRPFKPWTPIAPTFFLSAGKFN